ncbi:hypothetical protein [Terasakiella pusilla]|uniref:hypothetical protein n=1 Tax=Terasakiella pusilla TaxID=64973 RepID=UPI003AA7FB7A
MNLPIKLKTILSLGVLSLSLSACAAPPALQLLSLAIDGISYIATDKTLADHGLSAVSQQDCKMLRTFQGEDICMDENADQPPQDQPLAITDSEEKDAILLSEKRNVPTE